MIFHDLKAVVAANWRIPTLINGTSENRDAPHATYILIDSYRFY